MILFLQYLDIIAEELNVKSIGLPVGESEKGLVEIVYVVAEKKFYYHLAGKRLDNLPSEKVIEGLCGKFLK